MLQPIMSKDTPAVHLKYTVYSRGGELWPLYDLCTSNEPTCTVHSDKGAIIPHLWFTVCIPVPK